MLVYLLLIAVGFITLIVALVAATSFAVGCSVESLHFDKAADTVLVYKYSLTRYNVHHFS